MDRRIFVKNAGILASAGLAFPGIAGQMTWPATKNKLPKWKGFNLLDFFSPDPASGRKKTDEEQLKWMSDWGFDFIRIPMAYPYYTKFDRSRNIRPEEVYQIDKQAVDRIDRLELFA